MNNSTCHLLWRNLAGSFVNVVPKIHLKIVSDLYETTLFHLSRMQFFSVRKKFSEKFFFFGLKIHFLIRVGLLNHWMERFNLKSLILNLPIDLENDLLIKIMTRIIEFDFANFLHLKLFHWNSFLSPGLLKSVLKWF